MCVGGCGWRVLVSHIAMGLGLAQRMLDVSSWSFVKKQKEIKKQEEGSHKEADCSEGMDVCV